MRPAAAAAIVLLVGLLAGCTNPLPNSSGTSGGTPPAGEPSPGSSPSPSAKGPQLAVGEFHHENLECNDRHTFQVTVRNTGSATAKDVTVEAMADDGAKANGAKVGELMAGASRAVSLSIEVPDTCGEEDDYALRITARASNADAATMLAHLST